MTYEPRTHSSVIELKKSRTNGPMPNALATELRKVMADSPNENARNGGNLTAWAPSLRNSNNNVDLSKFAESKQQLPSVEPTSLKKGARSRSPFERL